MKINRKQIRYSLQLLLHLQKNKVVNNQDGYAMLITSILAILMFSMLSVYLFSANMYKSVASAVVDSGSTFYAAESGMNRRASNIVGTFIGYAQPTGAEPAGTDIVTQMQNCISNPTNAANTTVGTGDLRCGFVDYEYKESAWKARGSSTTEEFRVDPDVRYRVHTFVKRITTEQNPAITRIPAGEPFAGLNMQEYRYRLYATAFKNTSSAQSSAQTLLQMDFNSRIVPIFQFAAFYQGNMEITSSSNMDLNGRIHSNANIYLSPGAQLTVGQTTAVGTIYKSLNAINPFSSIAYPAGSSIVFGTLSPTNPGIDVSNGFIANPPAGGTPIDPNEISARNGLIVNNSQPLNLPLAGLLDTTGNYFNSADIQVTFDPDNLNAHPWGFGMTTVRRVPATATTAATATPTVFTNSMLRSLRQPVMAVTQAHGAENKVTNLNTTEWINLCTATPAGGATQGAGANFTAPGTNSTAAGVTLNTLPAGNVAPAGANADSNALRVALSRSTVRYSFNQINNSTINSLNEAGGLRANLSAAFLAANGGLTPRQVANRAGNCFLPAPMQVLNTATNANGNAVQPNAASQQERQEGRRLIKILQANIHSLTVWNRDGQYDDGTTNLPSNAAGLVFAPQAATGTNVGSYEWMGMATSDTSEGGLVWHSAVDTTVPAANRGVVINPAPAPETGNGLSQYGFGFSGGRWLPGPLTIATDQIAYVQGDFNNPGGIQPIASGDPVFSNLRADGLPRTDGTGPQRLLNFTQKKPSAILADTIAVLSNNCINGEGQLNCFNIADGSPLAFAIPTTVNAAFLSGTTDNNRAGVNNYMRMMENWNGIIFRYRGSFISTGAPLKMSGIYRAASSSNALANNYYRIPARDFGYDNSFDNAIGLPPLTPQVVTLKQKVFRRDYRTDRTQ
jgi:hypothetical protein